jgi:hypothetical protein
MSRTKLSILDAMVRQGVRDLVATTELSEWLETQKKTEGDILVVNNSFVYRKPLIKTSKNEQYLCLGLKNGKPHVDDVLVTKPGDLNVDFKLLSARANNLPDLQPLDEALQTELKRIGTLVFVLLGELEDVRTAVDFKNAYADELRFEPSAKSGALVEKMKNGRRVIVVNQLVDPETAWSIIKPEIEDELAKEASNVETAFGAAFERLQDEARSKLSIPPSTASKSDTSFIGRLRDSVKQQRKLYNDALKKCSGATSARASHLNEVLRIAYNFAEDAIKVLQLVVSISDLKAVLLWSTIKEQFDVAEAFRKLPWTKSDKKPSLKRYQEIINGARNRAFHNLLAFERTIEADLDGVTVNAKRLTLMPAHGRTKNIVAFDYEDREMVEVLTELTRAPETTVPLEFWKKNSAVMESFEKLLASVEKALWALNQARRS